MLLAMRNPAYSLFGFRNHGRRKVLPWFGSDFASIDNYCFHEPDPLFLAQVEQLATMFERKNKSRLSWILSTANPVSVSGVHGLLELSAIASESSCTQDRLVEAMGQGSSVVSASPTSLATNEVAKGENFLHEIVTHMFGLLVHVQLILSFLSQLSHDGTLVLEFSVKTIY